MLSKGGMWNFEQCLEGMDEEKSEDREETGYGDKD